MMAKPFKWTINVDIRDSEPDRVPFEPPVAPYAAPNVIYMVHYVNNFLGVSGEPCHDLEREPALMLMRA
jgi:hypothetical protein